MNAIIYKNHPIYTMNDLKSIMPNSSSDVINNNDWDVKDFTKKFEDILLQNSHRNYTLSDMLRTQDYLEALEFLETLKYLPNYTNARKMLHQYLHSRYNISSCNMIRSLKPGQIRLTKQLDLEETISYNDSTLIDIPEEKNQRTPAKSLRDYLTRYLTLIKNNGNPQVQCGIFSSDKIGTDNKQRFYLQLSEIPEFLLLFTYYDGRDFSHSQSQKNPHKIPPVRKDRQCSKFSYGLTLNKIQECYGNTTSFSPYDISTMLRCDMLFFHLKLNIFMKYFEYYTSSEILNQIIQSHSFTYGEIIGLKDFLVDKIFKDSRFISVGLESPYLDFMLPFDIHFQYHMIYSSGYSHGTTFTNFCEKLRKVKNDTQTFWSDKSTKIFYNSKNPVFTFEPGKRFSIIDNEMTIYRQLKKDTFFKTYFCSENKFIHSFLEHQDQSLSSLLNFEMIKKILPIIQKG